MLIFPKHHPKHHPKRHPTKNCPSQKLPQPKIAPKITVERFFFKVTYKENKDTNMAKCSTKIRMDCCLPSTNISSALVRSFFNPQLNLIAAYIHAKIIICKYDHLMKCIQQPVTCSKQPLQLKHIQFNSMHNIPIHVQNLQLSLRSIFWIWQGTRK